MKTTRECEQQIGVIAAKLVGSELNLGDAARLMQDELDQHRDAVRYQALTEAYDLIKEREALLENNNCKDTIREHYAANAILQLRDRKDVK